MYNEYQVAYQKARSEANLRDESIKARALLKDHDAVVMLNVTRYCPYTDAILGADITVEFYGTIDEAKKFMGDLPDYQDNDVYYYVLNREIPSECRSYNLVDNDEDIPF